MAKLTVDRKDAAAIRDRLLRVVKDHYPSLGEFRQVWRKRYGLGGSQASAWFREADPSRKGPHPTPPGVPYLLRLARRHRVSLDWLLLNRGTPYLSRFEVLGDPLGIARLTNAELARLGLMRREQCDAFVHNAVQAVAQGALLQIKKQKSRRKPQPRRKT